MVDEVEKLGFPSGVYANPSWIETYLEKDRILDKKDLWLAHWVSSPRQYGQKLWQSGLKYSAGLNIDADVCFVDYPAETAAWYKAHGVTVEKPAKKTLEEIVAEVWAGKWGDGEQRYNDLIAAGYDYYAIQDEIERRIAEQKKKSESYIKVGSIVTVNNGAKTYNGGSLYRFVYGRPHTVTELIGDRAVINYGNVVVAAVNVKDLTAVDNNPMSYKTRQAITLNNAKLYSAAGAEKPVNTICGTFYLYDGVDNDGYFRICPSAANVGKTPMCCA